jgi:hypothetical protein
MFDVKCERFNNAAPLICKSYGDQKELNYIETEERKSVLVDTS